MNDGTDPLRIAIRVLAAVLGVYLLLGGVLIFVTGISELPRLWLAPLQGVARAS